jgi:hypothetical protein
MCVSNASNITEQVHPICRVCHGNNVELREFKESLWCASSASWDTGHSEYENYIFCKSCGCDYPIKWVPLSEWLTASPTR